MQSRISMLRTLNRNKKMSASDVGVFMVSNMLRHITFEEIDK